MKWNDGLEVEYEDIAGYDGTYSCVIAGAGTGKSFALKRKVARLLEQGQSPTSLLVITFTRTAVKDIRNDLQSLEVDGCEVVRASTLHSLCFSILSKHEVFRVMGRHTRTLLDHETDFLRADLSVRLGRGMRGLKEQLHALGAAWARLQSDEPGWPHNEDDRAFHNETLAWLRFHRAMLVGELVPLTIDYLRSNPTSPETSSYRHTIVDEYQDLNKAEQTLVKLLAGGDSPGDRTLTVAGDDDQAIFVTLKYAHPEGITSFCSEYPGALERTLTVCKRCPKLVISMANSFVEAVGRKKNPKLLQPAPDALEGDVHILHWRTPREEAVGVAELIARRIKSGDIGAADVIVLTPRKEIGYEIVRQLSNRGIMAKTCYSDAIFKGNKCAQEMYAYLTLLHNRNDAVALRVLLGIDANDKRSRQYNRIREYCFESGYSVDETLSRLSAGTLNISRSDSVVARYGYICEELATLSTLELPRLVDRLFPAGDEETEQLRELALSALESVTDIHELYDELNGEILQPELPQNTDTVLCMTLQKAKGLTAKMVVVVNCIEGCMPFKGEYGPSQEEQEELAEQERLFFVALTRTSNCLILSSTGSMRRGDAARMQVRTGRQWYWAETHASRFLTMLGPDAPTPELGEIYLRRI